MTPTVSLRRATLADLAAIDRLLVRSYARLLAADYPASTLALAVPRFARARPELLASAHYFVAAGADGTLLAAGGWSEATPSGRQAVRGLGHVRHVATDPCVVRQGVGRALMRHVLQDALDVGVRRLECLSTLTAVPFYRALGFRVEGQGTLDLGAGIGFAVTRMQTDLP
jgi:GNAT superfamily N-acetyltransferase